MSEGRAFVGVRLGDAYHELVPGDVIGRMRSAALPIDDPRVSEAHAMISWRYGAQWLLSLRRLIAVGGKPLSEVELTPGLRVTLAEGLELSVERVVNPTAVMAIEAPNLGVRPLAPVVSLYAGPPPRVVDRFEPGAAAHLWWSGEDWKAADDDGERVVGDGDVLTVSGCGFRVRTVLADGAGRSTSWNGAIASPLRIVAHYDTVELHRAARPVASIGGIGARIIGELVSLDGPTDWETVAREVWNDGSDAFELRRRWDAALRRLRDKLRANGIRGDLLRADGAGQCQLVLYEGDTVEDRT